MKPNDKVAAILKEKELARLEALREDKYVRVADEDDDREWNRSGSYGPGEVCLNPMYEKARLEGRSYGWFPAISYNPKTQQEVYLPRVPTLEEAKKTIGVFWATLGPRNYYPDPFRWDGKWAIICHGGDDHSIGKFGMTEAKARRIWAMLNNHITARTLHRLGFAPW